jgi:hypothetical protein
MSQDYNSNPVEPPTPKGLEPLPKPRLSDEQIRAFTDEELLETVRRLWDLIREASKTAPRTYSHTGTKADRERMAIMNSLTNDFQRVENEMFLRSLSPSLAKRGLQAGAASTTTVERLTAGRLRLIPSMRQLIVESPKKETITLPEQQTEIFRVLFVMHAKGILEVPIQEVFKRADIPQRAANTKTSDLFQSRPGIWGNIVKSGKRGTIRLVT